MLQDDADKLYQKRQKLNWLSPKKGASQVKKDSLMRDIMKEIEDTKTPTVNILKEESDEEQSNVCWGGWSNFDGWVFEAQKAQNEELESEIVRRTQETVI